MNRTKPSKTGRFVFKRIFASVVLSTTSMFAIALPSDRNQPITLEAERATYNDKTGVTTYSGNVEIVQGTLKINANSIVGNLNANRKITSVTATGSPAKFQQQLESNRGIARGEAAKIVYNAESGIITLTGNAYLYQDGASIRGNNLRYSINKGDIEVSGGGNSGTGNSKNRIQIIIPPSASQSFSGVRD